MTERQETGFPNTAASPSDASPSDASLTADPALRAVIAADRLAFAETFRQDEALLRRRLVVFYGYFAGLVVLSWAASLTDPIPVEWGRRTATLIRITQTGHAFTLAAVFLGLRFVARSRRSLRTLDAMGILATAFIAGAGLWLIPQLMPAIDVSATAFFILFFTARAALVPGDPWWETLLAGMSALPFGFGIAKVYERGGATSLPDPSSPVWASVGALAAGVIGVYVVSRTVYGLRSAAERAIQLGQYVIHEKIGEGGMGSVYRASHAMLKRPTAIKLISPTRTGERASARFEREALAASRLSHPNNIAIYDFGRTRGGVFYYAMELLDGENLAELVARDGPQTEPRAVHILRQIAAALAEAHAAGLVHRDIKPENVMLCARGGVTGFVKVLDFGLVKDVATLDEPKLTNDAALAGTPLYMAPEAITAPDTVSFASDTYAFGCLAFLLLTGRPPFPGTNLVEVCAAHLHTIPEPPSTYAPSPISSELDRLVLRCLEKKSEARPTMSELSGTLGGWRG